jgi:hypothetical protein
MTTQSPNDAINQYSMALIGLLNGAVRMANTPGDQYHHEHSDVASSRAERLRTLAKAFEVFADAWTNVGGYEMPEALDFRETIENIACDLEAIS